MGVATINAKFSRGIIPSTVYGFFSGVGFALALVLFASLREKLRLAQVPETFQGMAIALVTAGILAMAFVGFSGLC
jgi:electron transport complex protein RnfA